MTGDCCDHVVSRCTGCVEPAQCVGAGALESECTAFRCGAGALEIECTVVQKFWTFCAPCSAPQCVTSPCVLWPPKHEHSSEQILVPKCRSHIPSPVQVSELRRAEARTHNPSPSTLSRAESGRCPVRRTLRLRSPCLL